MLKKNLILLSNLLFWLTPILLYFNWKIALIYPSFFWIALFIACVLIILVVYEINGHCLSELAVAIFFNLVILIISFYLFISLIASPWILSFLWLIMIWHLYRYFFLAKKSIINHQKENFLPIVFVNTLVSSFFASASLFGFQSFLTLSSWPLLIIFYLLLIINTQSLAIIQNWHNQQNQIIWFLITLFALEITMMITLLPLNYLISGILSTLIYYSALNFTRLYLNNNLKRSKIRNYAWFIVISLIIILLSARWL